MLLSAYSFQKRKKNSYLISGVPPPTRQLTRNLKAEPHREDKPPLPSVQQSTVGPQQRTALPQTTPTGSVSLHISGLPSSLTIERIQTAVCVMCRKPGESVEFSCLLWAMNLGVLVHSIWPQLLWSSGQRSWLQIQRSWVWFPLLPDFLRNSGSGTGSTQPREYNWGATWKRNNSGSGLENREYGHGNMLRWSRDTLYEQKLALTSPTSGGRSVSIVHSRAKTTEFSLL
jgi:hypothetical protein